MAAPVVSRLSAVPTVSLTAEPSKNVTATEPGKVATVLTELNSSSLITRIRVLQSQLKLLSQSDSTARCDDVLSKTARCLQNRRFSSSKMQSFADKISAMEKRFNERLEHEKKEREEFVAGISISAINTEDQVQKAVTLEEELSDCVFIRHTATGIEGLLCETRQEDDVEFHVYPHCTWKIDDDVREDSFPENWPCRAATLEKYLQSLEQIKKEQAKEVEKEVLDPHFISGLISDPYLNIPSDKAKGKVAIKDQSARDLHRLSLNFDKEKIYDGTGRAEVLYKRLLEKLQHDAKLDESSVKDSASTPKWDEKTIATVVENIGKLLTQASLGHLTDKIFWKYNNPALGIMCSQKHYSVEINSLESNKSKLEFVHHVYFIVMNVKSNPESTVVYIEGIRRVEVTKENLAKGCTDAASATETMMLYDKDPLPSPSRPVEVPQKVMVLPFKGPTMSNPRPPAKQVQPARPTQVPPKRPPAKRPSREEPFSFSKWWSSM